MHDDTNDSLLYVLLLESEVAALRSVLAEFDGDKAEFTQMHKADACAHAREHMRRPDL
jgi:hypothetical protein